MDRRASLISFLRWVRSNEKLSEPGARLPILLELLISTAVTVSTLIIDIMMETIPTTTAIGTLLLRVRGLALLGSSGSEVLKRVGKLGAAFSC